MAVSPPTSGTSSPRCMRSATLSNILPSLPPGCNAWKRSGENPLRSSRAMAMASPSASITVVDVVGARPMGLASSLAGRTNATSAACARALSARPVMAIRGMWNRFA